MAGAHARTVPSSSVLRSGNALLGNEGGNGFAQPTLSSLAARRSQFGGANMLAGYTNNPLINGVTNAGLAGRSCGRAWDGMVLHCEVVWAVRGGGVA